ncbi:hypothetical protein N7513_003095 [Penicillium frequentans]|uniref:Fructose-bisphosphate aldolase n=1 Tax=Penicillium frequentans TaxID=3151616 RepID=A0AAD6D9I9_9EURO|nr:hypothetical protein N7494_001420 [Penicillium glabrum]KAJ5560696.1 hypothetical protein N7513_003095 [Penicillium glabrum]
MDTGDLAGILTNPDDVEEFIASGIDFLAPSVGNVHGDYGPKGPELDLERLQGIFKSMNGRVRLVLHGTNDTTGIDSSVHQGWSDQGERE